MIRTRRKDDSQREKDTILPCAAYADSDRAPRKKGGGAKEDKRNAKLGAIIENYNQIVMEKESDPSLRIEFEAK